MSDLFGGELADLHPPGLKPARGKIGFGDPMPPGPYAVGLTHTQTGDSRPFTIICTDGRAIAGHVESRACAEAIVAALNRAMGETG